MKGPNPKYYGNCQNITDFHPTGKIKFASSRPGVELKTKFTFTRRKTCKN
jgi:hypothetical protein